MKAFEILQPLSFIFPNPSITTFHTTIFWLRISPTTLTILTATLHTLTSSLHSTLSLPQYRQNILYQPSPWYGFPHHHTTPNTTTYAIFQQPRTSTAFETLRYMQTHLLTQAAALGSGNYTEMSGFQEEARRYWTVVMDAKSGEGVGGKLGRIG
jgi:hypothetical protein